MNNDVIPTNAQYLLNTTSGLDELCHTTGKPLLQVMWGPEKGRTDIVEGVGFEVAVPHSGALTARRGGRVRQRVGAMCPW
jgi:hypothetical protein